MELKHKPNPWIHHDHGWLVVESTCGELYIKIEKGSCAKKQIADAQIIAAAPEMLEAAKLVLEWYEAEDNHSGTDFYQRMQMCRDSEDAIRAAIAKATGQQP